MLTAYGSVRFAQGGASSAQTFTSTPAVLAALNAAGSVSSSGQGDRAITPNGTTNSLDILVTTTTADYLILFSGAFTTSGSATGKYTFQLYKDGVAVPAAYGSFSAFGTDGDHAASFHHVLSLSSADDADADGIVKLKVYGFSGGSIAAFPKSASLTAIRLK